MWNRYDIKDDAKELLRKCYWPAFVVSLVLGIVTGGSGGGGGQSTFKWSESKGIDPGWIVWIILIGLAVLVFGFLIKVFIGYALEVGARRFFMSATKDDVRVGYLTSIFGKPGFRNIVKVMFIRSVLIIAWTFLLIVPGIIKFYTYRMVPYILAENPHIDGMKALELSEEMTNGEKFNIFILDVSFIGWYLLGGLLCGVGIVFVMPYVNMTQAVLYDKLRTKIVEAGDGVYLTDKPYNVFDDE